MRTATAVMLFGQVACLVWWGARNPDQFRDLSAVVKTLWGAAAAFVVAFGIRQRTKKQRPMSTVFGEPPVQAIVWISAVVSLVWIVATTETHRIAIRPDSLSAAIPFDITLTRAGSPTPSYRATVSGTWSSRVSSGRYMARVEPRGFRPESLGLEVGPFDGLFRGKQFLVAKSPPVKGRLLISWQPEGVAILVRPEFSFDALRRATLRGQDPLRLECDPGRYWIVGRASGFASDSENVEVFPVSQTVSGRTLGTVKSRSTLVLNVTPEDLEVLVNGRLQAERTPATLSLPPGSYRVILRGRVEGSDQSGYYIELPVALVGEGRRVIHETVPVRALPRLRVVDPTPGAEYVLRDASGERHLDVTDLTNGVYLLPGRYTMSRRAGGTQTERTFDMTGDRTLSFED